VKQVMEKACDKVEQHYWWQVPLEKKEEFKTTWTVPNDIMISYVGYVNKTDTDAKMVDIRMRSRMVVAPLVPKEGDSSGFVAKEFYEQHSAPGEMVADIMCRTGNNALAAAALGRHSFSMDNAEEKVCVH
jgi:hypothetical protein